WASPRDLARLMRSVGAGRTCPAELRAARRASGPAQAREIARRGRITCIRHRPGAHEFGGLLEARPSPFYTQSENALGVSRARREDHPFSMAPTAECVCRRAQDRMTAENSRC